MWSARFRCSATTMPRKNLGMVVPTGVKWVGFSTTNTIVNTDYQAVVGGERSGQRLDRSACSSRWAARKWSCLSRRQPRATSSTTSTSPRCHADRLAVHEKEGLSRFQLRRPIIGARSVSVPRAAKPVLGSYTEAAQLLTIVRLHQAEGRHEVRQQQLGSAPERAFRRRYGQQLQRRPGRTRASPRSAASTSSRRFHPR